MMYNFTVTEKAKMQETANEFGVAYNEVISSVCKFFDWCKIKEKEEIDSIKTMANLTDEEILKLRKDVVLFSMYVKDYRNNIGIDPHEVCDFFFGYEDYIYDMMREDGKDYSELDKYDTDDNIIEFYHSIEYTDGYVKMHKEPKAGEIKKKYDLNNARKFLFEYGLISNYYEDINDGRYWDLFED